LCGGASAIRHRRVPHHRRVLADRKPTTKKAVAQLEAALLRVKITTALQFTT
jgi:hypothetical protein